MIGAPITRTQIALMAAAMLFVILKIPLYGMRMSFLGFDMSLRRYLLIAWALVMPIMLISAP